MAAHEPAQALPVGQRQIAHVSRAVSASHSAECSTAGG